MVFIFVSEKRGELEVDPTEGLAHCERVDKNKNANECQSKIDSHFLMKHVSESDKTVPCKQHPGDPFCLWYLTP